MRKRIITAVLGLLIFLPIIILDFHNHIFLLSVLLLGTLSMYELLKMKGLKILSLEGIISSLATIFLIIPSEYYIPFLPKTIDKLTIFYFLFMLLLSTSIICNNIYVFDKVSFLVVSSLYIGIGFGSFLTIRNQNLVALFYGLFIVWATDIGAYLIGKKYGKNKLLPVISPNKTIEGFLGGIISTLIVIICYLSIYSDPNYFNYSSYKMLFFAFILSIFAQLGDFVESSIKRFYKVKDSGSILPGHGGILDRVDSMLFVFPIMSLFNFF